MTKSTKVHQYSTERDTVAVCGRNLSPVLMATSDPLVVTCSICKIKSLNDKLVANGYATKGATGNYNRKNNGH